MMAKIIVSSCRMSVDRMESSERISAVVTELVVVLMPVSSIVA